MHGEIFEVGRDFSGTPAAKSLHLASTYPFAAVAFERRLESLKALTAVPGWDDGWGDPIPAIVWGHVKKIAMEVIDRFPDFLPTPSAEGDGTIFVRWTVPDGVDGLLEIRGQNIFWTTIGSNKGDQSIPLPDSNEEIVQAIVHSLC